MAYTFDIEKLLTIDDTGMPKAPNIKQIQDKDVMLLYTRDHTSDKRKYIAEVGVIYYLGDPKSPAKQQGLSDDEALKMAIENYNLPSDYVPDILVRKLIEKYYYSNITEAGVALEALRKSVHLVSLAATKINELLTFKNGVIGMVHSLSEEGAGVIFLTNADSLKAGDRAIPTNQVLNSKPKKSYKLSKA